MFFTQPYETLTGKLVNTSLITNSILRYITGTGGQDLSYGFPIAGYETIYITGKNKEEKDMLVWDFPLLFKDVRNRLCVAIDLRPYVVNANKPFESLSEIARDKTAIILLQVLAAVTEKVNQDVNYIKPILANISTAFTAIILSAVNRITALNAIDKVNIEIACHIYMHMQMYPNNNVRDDSERIVNFLHKVRLSAPLDRKTLQVRVDSILANKNLENKLISFSLLGELLRGSIPEDMSSVVNMDAITNMLNNSWFGPGSTKATYIALEYIPMLVAMVYSCATSGLYKNTKIGLAIENSKRYIRLDEIENFIFNNIVKKELGEI